MMGRMGNVCISEGFAAKVESFWLELKEVILMMERLTLQWCHH